METYRLKNIAIVILLLLNACLLFMVGQQYFQSLQTQRRSAAQLRELYRSSQLALDSRLDLSQQPLDILTLARQAETERAIAAALLGGEALATSQGGGIYSYEAHDSTIQFRAGGSFYGSRLDLPVEDAAAFARSFCNRFGYEEPRLRLEGGTGSAVAGQLARDIPVINCAEERFSRNAETALVCRLLLEKKKLCASRHAFARGRDLPQIHAHDGACILHACFHDRGFRTVQPPSVDSAHSVQHYLQFRFHIRFRKSGQPYTP